MGYRCRSCGIHYPGEPAAVHVDQVPNKICDSCLAVKGYKPENLRTVNRPVQEIEE